MNLTVTDDKVRAAADKCPNAKNVLTALFPEAFASDFDLRKLSPDGGCTLFSDSQARNAGFNSYSFMQVRGGGLYVNRAFWLDRAYNWALKDDKVEGLLLIPTRK